MFTYNLLQYIKSYLNMKVLTLVFTLLALSSLVQASWIMDHHISGDASTQLSAAIKAKILSNIDKLANPTTAQAIAADLNQADDSKRTLTSIDSATANELFSLFGLKDPNCDKNNDGNITGTELACLSKIWKNFVPQ